MNKYPKRLIEVDLPIKRISAHARREKDMRLSHIPQLHIYPAARPLAACRAVLCTALWPDPADELCPDMFRQKARELMHQWAKNNLKLLSNDSLPHFIEYQKTPSKLNDNLELRKALLDFIADFANWDNSTVKEFLETSRTLTQTAHEAFGGQPGTRPLVVDPFAGGGAIPLESLRVNADVFASDLNPLAVLINRVILKYIPQFGKKLVSAINDWETWVSKKANEILKSYYPMDSNGRIAVAFLWARTIISESPDGGKLPVEVPLLRSMWLARKGRRIALRWVSDKNGSVITEDVEVTYANGEKRKVRRPLLEVFEPKNTLDVIKGTAARNSVTCPVTGYTTSPERVRNQLISRKGGASDARLYCIVTMDSQSRGRIFRIPTPEDFNAVEKAVSDLSKKSIDENGFPLIPDEPFPVMSGVFNAPLWGHSTWGSLFTSRQILAITTYAKLAREYSKVTEHKDHEFGAALSAVLGLIIDRLADLNASLCVWQLNTPNNAHVFGRWALPMVMDFAEINPLAGAGGSPKSAIRRATAIIEELAKVPMDQGHVEACSATEHPLPNDSAHLFFTDPPYYNAIPYADISDFFYVWLKRSVFPFHKDLLAGNLTPKDDEICEMSCWDPVRYSNKDKAFFERNMTLAMAEGRRVLIPEGLGVVVFAHKTTTGWEALLKSLIDAGFVITASWPIDTEMVSRLRAKASAALASSVHIVIRPRENLDGSLIEIIGDWRDVLTELPKRIHEWMPRLAEEGVVGADAIFACLGPALEIFSKYSKVEKASGEQVTLKEYLEQVWAAVAKEALNVIFAGADATGFEEDSRLTAMWLWTLFAGATGNGKTEKSAEDESSDEETESNGKKKKAAGSFVLEYDAARKIAQGLGAHLENLTSVVEITGDKARLLSVAERTKYLFGKDEAQAPVSKRKKKDKQIKMGFMKEVEEVEEQAGGWGEKTRPAIGNTVLDQLHQAMILFAAGRGEALKRFIVEDGVGRDSRFWRLGQAFSALYPKDSEEKRWVDGVLARKKGLGF